MAIKPSFAFVAYTYFALTSLFQNVCIRAKCTDTQTLRVTTPTLKPKSQALIPELQILPSGMVRFLEAEQKDQLA